VRFKKRKPKRPDDLERFEFNMQHPMNRYMFTLSRDLAAAGLEKERDRRCPVRSAQS
jgi:hypothetical protein